MQNWPGIWFVYFIFPPDFVHATWIVRSGLVQIKAICS